MRFKNAQTKGEYMDIGPCGSISRLSAHLEAELTGRNPIDEPMTEDEYELRLDALDALYGQDRYWHYGGELPDDMLREDGDV